MYPNGHGRTDAGRIRETNEDRLLVDDEIGLYAIADGMGGCAAGQVAATVALDVAKRFVCERLSELPAKRSLCGLCALLNEACQSASHEIYELARSRQDYRGMGCTLTLLLVRGRQAVVAHVGDTRLYLHRRGRLRQLTRDHTWAEELVTNGAIPAEQGRTHPWSHMLTRALGGPEPVQVDVTTVVVQPGDVFLLCSDGLTHHVEGPERLAREIESARLESLPDALVEFANRSGGDDNVTVVAVRVEKGHSSAPRCRTRPAGSVGRKGPKPLRDDRLLAGGLGTDPLALRPGALARWSSWM